MQAQNNRQAPRPEPEGLRRLVEALEAGMRVEYRHDHWERVDAEICREERCEVCGEQGLRYLPLRRPGSYRSFALCMKCGFVVEF